MELSERCIQTLENEGFVSVYEWTDAPGVVYEEHVHQGPVTIFVTDGSLIMKIGKETRELRTGERFDVPMETPHSAVVGPEGCQYVVGEMIPGDA